MASNISEKSGLPIEFPHYKSYPSRYACMKHHAFSKELKQIINLLTDECLQDAFKSSEETYVILEMVKYVNSKILMKYKNNTEECVSFSVFEEKYYVYDLSEGSMEINHYNHWMLPNKLTNMIMFRLMEHPEYCKTFRAYVSKYKVYIKKIKTN
jgi:hypothetical protein